MSRDADQRAIKEAFRTLALKYHPDRNKTPDAEARFKEIAEAYAVLSDPKKRADYEARGFESVADVRPQDLFSGINFDDIFGDIGFHFGGGWFDELWGHRRAGPRQGADIEVKTTVSLDRVMRGGQESLRYRHAVVCGECHGSGVIQRHSCPMCEGRGQLMREESLSVRIPPGIEDGVALRIAGKGMPSPDEGGPPGDLLVVVFAEPDARFQRMGADLMRHETIDLTDAVLGTTLRVPTLEGSVSVSVPAGTQPDTVLRLKKKGLPAFGGGRRGDLYVRLAMVVPTQLSSRERSLYEQLRDDRARSKTGPRLSGL